MYALILAALIALDDPIVAAGSGPKLVLPPQLQALPGKHFVVKADTTCKWLRWTIPPGLERVDPKDTVCGDNGFVGYGPTGTYTFKVEGTLNDQFSEATCTVVVGRPKPPGPEPTPPGPPSDPSDPLIIKLKPFYLKAPAANRAESLAQLAVLYRDLCVFAKEDGDLKTYKQLFETARAAAKFHIKGNLLDLRGAIADETGKQFPADGTVDEAARAKACAWFTRIASVLSALE